MFYKSKGLRGDDPALKFAPMGRSVGLLAVMITLVIGGYYYRNQLQNISPGGAAPSTAIDTVAVRNDLMAMANAERRYWATNSRYATIDDLRNNGDIHVPSRENYSYSAQVSDTGFKILATYSGPDPKAPKHISVDETLSLKTD
jgi:hypothetical protein